jgi:hypothetical protein
MAIENGQSRDTDNITHTRHSTNFVKNHPVSITLQIKWIWETQNFAFIVPSDPILLLNVWRKQKINKTM